jgi:L-ascorbate metabolism protein UlaG (beta-lactamase superfamily)
MIAIQGKRRRPVRSWILFCTLMLGSLATAGGGVLDPAPEPGEARVWYLGHAGWLVRTSEHCLVFDYTGPVEDGALKNGALSPGLLAGKNVVVFISHAHGDHYNREVLGLRDGVKDLAVVMGWDEPGVGDAIVPADGQWTEVSGARILTLHHEYDGIPEGFFLVRSGGLTLYHSGDHGTWSDPPDETFRANIDRIAAEAGRIDLAFISAFGIRGGKGALNPGDVYSLETLEPRITFPMHRGGREEDYAAFAKESSALGLPTAVAAAEAAGAFFRYRGGKLH